MPSPHSSRNPESHEWQAFREALDGGDPDVPFLDTLIPGLREQDLLEAALAELKRRHPRKGPSDPWQPVRTRLETEAASALERRRHRWLMDPRRRTLRLRLEVRRPACGLHPPALQAALAQALLAADLPLAMGLEKSPRPMVRLGHPLPLAVEGLEEWADAVLREPPAAALEALPDLVSAHCPPGLRLLGAETIPNHASPVLELAREAHWAWICPGKLRGEAEARWNRFMATESFEIEKTGKVDGQKRAKRVEVRHLVLDAAWEGERLRFSTRLSPDQALHPARLLAGVLGLETSAITDLTRLRVVLGEDARLQDAGKYEPKLHNIYEDAVLLEGGPNIRIVDEDDDEPILL